jgi:hypothetical protein
MRDIKTKNCVPTIIVLYFLASNDYHLKQWHRVNMDRHPLGHAKNYSPLLRTMNLHDKNISIETLSSMILRHHPLIILAKKLSNEAIYQVHLLCRMKLDWVLG